MNIDDSSCYDCGAEPGERCVTRTGQVARRPHAYRREGDQDRVVSWRAAEIAASIHMFISIDFIPPDADRVAAHLFTIADAILPTDQDRSTVFRLAKVDNLCRPRLGYGNGADHVMRHAQRFADEVRSVGAAMR